jgi:hypothetical protein
MNWRKSATGSWVAYDGKNYYAVEPLNCFTKGGCGGGKLLIRYRLRVNQAAVGGADNTKLFASVAGAKKHAESMVKG